MSTQTLQRPKERRGQAVTTSHVDTLVRNYKKERWTHNSARLGESDSLSVWYGLDELETFLARARKNKADGIKMYFGVYPANFQQAPEISGRQTIVLVATRKTETGLGIANKDIYVQKDGNTEILAFNFANVCPPFCSSDDFPSIDIETIGISFIENNDGISIL